MPEETPDRRTLRTRHTLIHALLDLMEEKTYDQISVLDIVQQANVGRSTFYAHFENKDDLLISGFEHQLETLAEQIQIKADGQLQFETALMFAHAQRHADLYRTLIWGTGFKLIIVDGHLLLSRKIEERLRALLPDKQPVVVPLPVLSAVMAGVVMLLLKWWLDQKMPYTPREMDTFFQEVMLPGAKNGLGLCDPGLISKPSAPNKWINKS